MNENVSAIRKARRILREINRRDISDELRAAEKALSSPSVPTPPEVTNSIMEYDQVIAGITGNDPEADFVMRVADYLLLRGVICNAKQVEPPR